MLQDILDQGSVETTGLMEHYVSRFEDLAEIVTEEFLKKWKDARHTMEEYDSKITQHTKVTFSPGKDHLFSLSDVV